ncbi:MAG: type II toxin-antitoxin system prevent-host-death family antitoxin [Bacteroidota bacterium]
MSTISYSDARQNLAKLWDRIIADRETVILKRRGKEDLAVLPADDLSSLQETLYLLSTPENASRLLESIEWARGEEGKPQSVEAFREALGLVDDK